MEKIDLINSYLDELFPEPKCELNYSNDYELLISIMLSAQSTDKRVNQVTSILFDKYNSLEALNEAKIEDLENIIRSVGSFRKKSQYIKDIASTLITKYNGVVPLKNINLTVERGEVDDAEIAQRGFRRPDSSPVAHPSGLRIHQREASGGKRDDGCLGSSGCVTRRGEDNAPRTPSPVHGRLGEPLQTDVRHLEAGRIPGVAVRSPVGDGEKQVLRRLPSRFRQSTSSGSSGNSSFPQLGQG